MMRGAKPETVGVLFILYHGMFSLLQGIGCIVMFVSTFLVIRRRSTVA